MNNEYGDRVDALGRPAGSPGDPPVVGRRELAPSDSGWCDLCQVWGNVHDPDKHFGGESGFHLGSFPLSDFPELDPTAYVVLVEKGRVLVDGHGARVDMTDEVRRSILALTEARPLTGAVTIVVRAAQDIANQFGWLDEPDERGSNNDGYGFAGDGVSGRSDDPEQTTSYDRAYGESSPRNPNPRCKECGERLKASPRAEVYLDATTMRRDAGGQGALVDEIPESAFGPYLVHQEPCYLSNGPEGTRKYALA